MTTDLITSLLSDTLAPEQLDITDDSQAHAGHAGAQSGGGHYYIRITSSAFEGKSLVQRHQLIYKALGDLMKHEIHALGIEAFSPTESN